MKFDNGAVGKVFQPVEPEITKESEHDTNHFDDAHPASADGGLGPRSTAGCEEPVAYGRPQAGPGRTVGNCRGRSARVAYNYQSVSMPDTVKPRIAPGNQKYAVPRSDYIHPLYGLHGEILTDDWVPDHPHHRGIYWAWPEVDWQGKRGDLHALQDVFARPTGKIESSQAPTSHRSRPRTSGTSAMARRSSARSPSSAHGGRPRWAGRSTWISAS